MELQGARTLVTGAGGFIGSHLTEALVRAGATVTAFVRYGSDGLDGHLRMLAPDVRQHVRLVAGDLRDAGSIRRAMAGQQVVVHLGARIAIPYSYQDPVNVTETNVLGTLHTLDAAREVGVARFVHTSTSEVYGTAQRVPIDESHPLVPQSPYAASKVGADALALSYERSFGLPVSIVRPFNCYGPRQSGRAVIPALGNQALQRDEVRVGSLTPTRDFTYVTDTVDGFLAVAASDAAVGRTVNLASGREISIGDLAARLLRLVGRDLPIVADDSRLRPKESEVHRLLGDSTLAAQLTGWAPQVTLDAGLGQVLDFLRAHPDWTRPDRYEV